MKKNSDTLYSGTLKPKNSKLFFVDTHCHIHDSEFVKKYDKSQDEIISDAKKAGVKKLVCVGTSLQSSLEAVAFCKGREECFASLAIHPHEVAEHKINDLLEQFSIFEKLLDEDNGKIVAIGECGLDYYYHDSKSVRKNQITLFERHIKLASKYNLPMIFHIRDAQKQDEPATEQAFDDFFKIMDKYPEINGVVHSFSAEIDQLRGCMERGFYVGLNGIMTFTRDEKQLEAAKAVPLNKLLLETDAPFLTPAPFRGKMCEPKHVGTTAEFLSKLRGETLEEITENTSYNAEKLLGL